MSAYGCRRVRVLTWVGLGLGLREFVDDFLLPLAELRGLVLYECFGMPSLMVVIHALSAHARLVHDGG